MINHDGDRRVLGALAAHGADLRKPAHIIHFLYFRSQASAEAAGGELRLMGYKSVRVNRAPTTSIWKRLFGPKEFSCIAETHAVPEESAVFATTDRMNQLAAKHGGVYDGWEASVER